MLSPTTLDWVAYAVAAIFAIGGGVANLFPPPFISEGYKRWGYPSWWHYVTALLDFSGAALVAMRDTRSMGAILLAVVTVAAILTLIRHREYGHVPAPTVLLVIALLPLVLPMLAT